MKKLKLAEFGEYVKKNIPEFKDFDSENIAKVFLKYYPEFNEVIEYEEPTPIFNISEISKKGAEKILSNIEKIQEYKPSEPDINKIQQEVFKRVKSETPLDDEMIYDFSKLKSDPNQTKEDISKLDNLQEIYKYYKSQLPQLPTIQKGSKAEEFTKDVKSTGLFGISLINAIISTPVHALFGRYDLIKKNWDIVAEMGEKAPLDEISDKLELLLLVYGGIEGIKALPIAKDLIKYSDFWRKLTIKNRQLVNLSDDELMNIFVNSPKKIQVEMAKYNPRIRKILQKGGLNLREQGISATKTKVSPIIEQPLEQSLTKKTKTPPITPQEEIKPSEPIILPEPTKITPKATQIKTEIEPIKQEIPQETTIPVEQKPPKPEIEKIEQKADGITKAILNEKEIKDLPIKKTPEEVGITPEELIKLTKVKQPPLSKITENKTVMETKGGEGYTDGRYFIRKEFVPNKLKEKFDKIINPGGKPAIRVVEESLKNNEYIPISEIGIIPQDKYLKAPFVIFNTEDNIPIAVNKYYVDLFKKNVGVDVEFYANKNNPIESPLVIKKNGEYVGLIMPIKLDESIIKEKGILINPISVDKTDIIKKEVENKIKTSEYVEAVGDKPIEEIEKETQEEVEKAIEEGKIDLKKPETSATISEGGENEPVRFREEGPELSPEKSKVVQQGTEREPTEGVREGFSETSIKKEEGIREESVGEWGEGSDIAGPISERNDTRDVISKARKVTSNFNINNHPEVLQLQESTSIISKIEANIESIKTLKKIITENRQATPQEQVILSKYTGWGGLSRVFTDEKLKKYDDELYDLLDYKEYESIKSSVNNAHYTTKEVIDFIWGIVRRSGYLKGNVLEPAMGIGNFFGFMPRDLMNNSSLWGVELDYISGNIARLLYPKANIYVQGFETFPVKDNTFDLIVSNIPFGDYKVYDPVYSKYNWKIHDYFIAKSIDKLKEGGVGIFITSHYTMDKVNSSLRNYIYKKADLITAFRLPRTAFKNIANTEVVTDILVFRKRLPDESPQSDAWLKTEEIKIGNHKYNVNKFFIENKENILGIESDKGGMYSKNEYTVLPFENVDLKTALSSSINKVPINFFKSSLPTEIKIVENKDIEHIPLGGIHIKDNKLYRKERVGNRYELVEKDVKLDKELKNKFESFINLRDKFLNIVKKAKDENIPDNEILNLVKDFEKDYDNFVDKYGYLLDNKQDFAVDNSYFFISAIESKQGDKILKSDFFSTRKIKPEKRQIEFKSTKDALWHIYSLTNKINIHNIAELTKKSEQEVIDELQDLIIKNPETEEYEFISTYASGYVKDKLEIALQYAKIDPAYQRNVKILQSVMPPKLTDKDIKINLGSTWIPPDIIQDFINEKLGLPESKAKVYFNNTEGKWLIEYYEYKIYDNTNAISIYGTKDINAIDLLVKALNGETPLIYRTERVNGEKVKIKDTKATELAILKMRQIKEAFLEWVWSNEERKNRLVDIYNERFNNFVTPQFNGEYLEIEGINPLIELRDYQKDSIAKILYNKNTLLAFEVGGGKTFTALAAAKKMLDVGKAKKVLIVAPNHLVSEWDNSLKILFPEFKDYLSSAYIFKGYGINPQLRMDFLNKIISENPKLVIMPESVFNMIPPSIESLKRYIDGEKKILLDTINAINNDRKISKENKKITIKQLEAMIKRLDEMLSKLMAKQGKLSIPFNFEDFNFDYIIYDEVTAVKNLPRVTTYKNIRGLPSATSGRSLHTFIKVLDIQKKGGGFIGLTGTPLTNTLAEMHNWFRFFAPEILEKDNHTTFNSWVKDFGNIFETYEMKPNAKEYRQVSVFAKFLNIPELYNRFLSFAIPRSLIQMGIKVPKIQGGSPKIVTVQLSDFGREYVKQLAKRAENLKRGDTDNMLKISNEAKWLAIDQRLIDDKLPDYPLSKINVMIENVLKIYEDTKKDKLTQVIFCDIQQRKDSTFNVYKDIIDKLVAKGIPRKEIAVIPWLKKSQYEKTFAKINDGEIRIVIASTPTMGIGANIQKRLYALHSLDIPWSPWEIEQRKGRIIRFGNINEEVQLIYYITEKSFDAYILQTNERKMKAFGNILEGVSLTTREFEDPNAKVLTLEELKAVASGNPLIIEKMKLEKEIESLELQKQGFIANQTYLRRRLGELESFIDYAKNVIERGSKDLAHFKEWENKPFEMIIEGNIYNKPKEAGQAIIKIFKENGGKLFVGEIGTYKGKPIGIKNGVLWLKGELLYEGHINPESPEGSIRSLDYYINSKNLEKRINDLQNKINENSKNISSIKKDLEKKFEKDEELSKKILRLNEINSKLGINAEAEGITIDGKPEERIDDGDDSLDIGEEEFKIPDSIKRKYPDFETIQKVENKIEESFKNIDFSGLREPTPDIRKVETPEQLKEFMPHLEEIRPLEMNELYRLVRDLIGENIFIKEFTSSLGKFKKDKYGKKIILHPAIFQDPIIAAKVFAHEIGHLVDYTNLSEKLGKRNILARILNLKSFLKNIYDPLLASNKTIKQELINLSEWWNPISPNADSKYIKYRHSASELYADMVSVLLNSPASFKEKAPITWKLLWDNIKKKPDFLDTYLEIQKWYVTGEYLTEREKIMKTGFKLGNLKRLLSIREDKTGFLGSLNKAWNVFNKSFVDIKAPIYDLVSDITKKYGEIPSDINPLFAIQNIEYLRNDIYLTLDGLKKRVFDVLNNADLNVFDLDRILFLERVIEGDRHNLANPWGYTPETAKEDYAEIKVRLGDEKFNILKKVADEFRKWFYENIIEGKDILFNDNMIEAIENNKDKYVPFSVVNFIDSMVESAIPKTQKGTMSSIDSPTTAAILRVIAVKNRLNIERFKNSIIETLYKYKPEVIEKADIKQNITEPREEKDFLPHKDKKVITRLEKGKVIGYYVPEEIASAVNDIPISIDLRKQLMTNLWYDLIIKYNPGFIAFNIIRDLRDTITLTKINRYKFIYNMLKNIPDVAKYVIKGEMTPKIKEAIKNKVIDASGEWLNKGEVTFKQFDKELENILNKLNKGEKLENVITEELESSVVDYLFEIYGLNDYNNKKVIPNPLKILSNTLEMTELLTKLTTYEILNADKEFQGKTEYAAWSARYISGTPSYMTKGKFTPISNTIFMFSNMLIQSWRRMGWSATGKFSEYTKYSKSAFWFHTIKNRLPKFLMFLISSGILLEYMQNNLSDEEKEKNKETIESLKELKEMYDRIPEYDKTNYLCVPLSFYYPFENRKDIKKTVYLRLPRGHVDQLFDGLLWKSLNATYKGSTIGTLQIFDFLGTQGLPSLNPTISIVENWAKFLMGGNPIDDFWGRPIIPETEFNAGLKPRTMAMVKWTIDKTGLTRLSSYNSINDTTLELIIKSTPALNRFVKITDYGLVEMTKDKFKEIEEKKAELKLARSDELKTLLFRYYQLNQKYNVYKYEKASGGDYELSKEELVEFFRLKKFYYNIFLKYSRIINAKLRRNESANELIDKLNEVSKRFYENEKKKKG